MLEEFSFSVEYINGETNKVADALSRLEPQDSLVPNRLPSD